MNGKAVVGAIAAGLTTLGFIKLAEARGRIGPILSSFRPFSFGESTPIQPSGRVWVANSTIYGPGASMPITDTDALWLGRAITGEVSSSRDQRARAAVAWALAQNLMLVGRASEASPPRYSSFTGIIRAYCQPVNPDWESASSPSCQRSPQNCTAARLEQRARYRTMSWDDLSPDVRQIVDDFRAGRLANPVPGLVDWHANTYNGAVERIGGNYFGVLQGRRLLS